MEKVTGFLFQLIGAASRNPACNLPFGINRYVHRDPVISPEFPCEQKHSNIKRTLPPLGERLQRLFGIRGRVICQTERLPNECDAFSLHFPVRQECASRPSGLNFPE